MSHRVSRAVQVEPAQFNSQLQYCMQVADNGRGVQPKDYEALALKYHTSKLSDFSGLEVSNKQLSSPCIDALHYHIQQKIALCDGCGKLTVGCCCDAVTESSPLRTFWQASTMYSSRAVELGFHDHCIARRATRLDLA
eukprot:GHUV01058253.1.p1 GENE.GHUV01058253.1~~GHUV01058253.1.p1  ORF type:complete len:157 (-),score=20.07 GHUV01058253.1:184-597(-)